VEPREYDELGLHEKLKRGTGREKQPPSFFSRHVPLCADINHKSSTHCGFSSSEKKTSTLDTRNLVRFPRADINRDNDPSRSMRCLSCYFLFHVDATWMQLASGLRSGFRASRMESAGSLLTLSSFRLYRQVFGACSRIKWRIWQRGLIGKLDL